MKILLLLIYFYLLMSYLPYFFIVYPLLFIGLIYIIYKSLIDLN